MRFSVQREALLKPLTLLSGVVERRHTLPILSNVLLSARQDRLSITGTDLEVELVIDLPVELQSPGEVTLPARKFLDICRTLPEQGNIDLTVDGERAVVRCAKSRFTLSTLPASDFPNMEAVPSPTEFSVSQRDLKFLIDKTSFAMAQQDVRYYLNGLLLELSPNKLRSVATDGHRLALCEMPADITARDPQQVIVPRKGVAELSRLLEDGDTQVKVRLGANHIRVSLPGITFTSKLIDGRFPDYQRVLPKVGERVMTAARQELRQAMVRASILSNEKFRGVRLCLKPGSLTVQANNPELEEAEEELPVDYLGSELEIGFNVTYLLDALAAIDADHVELNFTDGNSSTLIRPSGVDNCKYVVMPMRL